MQYITMTLLIRITGLFSSITKSMTLSRTHCTCIVFILIYMYVYSIYINTVVYTYIVVHVRIYMYMYIVCTASQLSRTTGTIFLYVAGVTHTVNVFT